MSLSLSSGGSSARSAVADSTSLTAAQERTRRPIVTGTSVLGIRYAGGVMLSADTLCSYGSMAKYKDARRLISVNSRTLIGGGGEYSDFQSIGELLKRNALEDKCTADSLYEDDTDSSEDCAKEVWNYLRAVMYNRRNKMNPLWNDLIVAGFTGSGDDTDSSEECAKEVWNYLRAVMYNRRNKMNPLWNDLIVAGFTGSGDDSVPFLGYVDKIGTTYEDNFIATGFGSYLAIPILREKYRADLEEGEARALLEDCMRVLFYRDCRALNKIQIAKVTKDDGVLISDPYEIETDWKSASFVEPKGQLDGDGGW
eukprot:111906_1